MQNCGCGRSCHEDTKDTKLRRVNRRCTQMDADSGTGESGIPETRMQNCGFGGIYPQITQITQMVRIRTRTRSPQITQNTLSRIPSLTGALDHLIT